MDSEKSILETVAEMADFANAIASLVVGHRKILVEGGFDVNLADSMASALHAQMLGLAPEWEEDDDIIHTLGFLVGDHEEDEDE